MAAACLQKRLERQLGRRVYVPRGGSAAQRPPPPDPRASDGRERLAFEAPLAPELEALAAWLDAVARAE
jgi:hypothetical protein